MTFIEAQIAFRQVLVAQLAKHGVSIPVVQMNQSSKEGRLDKVIYFNMLNPINTGWQSRGYNPNQNNAGHTENQHYAAMMQITCLSDDDDLTSTDLAASVQMVVNSLPFVEECRKGNIGIQRASAIRTPAFINEHDDFEVEASFDVRISFNRTISIDTPLIDNFNPDLYRV